MSEKILIVEDQFIEADYLRMMLKKAGYHVTGIAHSVIQARELIDKQRPDIVLLDIFVKGKLTGIDLAKELAQKNIGFVYLSANSNEEVLNAAKATQPYGFLVKPYREKDLLIMLQIARYRHQHSIESRQRNEIILSDKLARVAASSETRKKKLEIACRTLQHFIAFDYLTAGFDHIIDSPAEAISFLRIGFDEYQQIGVSEFLTITKLKLDDLMGIIQNGSIHQLLATTFRVRSHISLPLTFSNRRTFTFSFYSKQPDNYRGDNLTLSPHFQASIVGSLESIFHEINIRESSTFQKNAHGEKPGEELRFEGIIGESPLLLNVFDLISHVAPVDTSVLILGESGTGKERIADCIHHHSLRKNKPFIKVNCAALPSTLIESELFGHEKGAFTGALEKRIGKFERADQGTLFLDEIGDLPLELQVKLLRVLQERYFERIGAKEVTKVNVRIIAATNRNLEKEVAEGRFRLDLYYRLNVFPIELPALRERMEDIPILVDHFIKYFNAKAGKEITGVSEKVITELMAYNWPGNIRELENTMERAVLLAKTPIIENIVLPARHGKEISGSLAGSATKTIDENERDYIIHILKRCNGKIFGNGGAAELLKIPPTTLISKMKRLGIQKI